MSEWKEFYLTDIGTLARGKSKHRPRWAEHLYGGSYPFIQTGEITAANKYVSTYQQTYSEAGLVQSKLWDKGTLCITIAANIAEIAILDFPACFPDSILGFVPNPEKANLDFVFYTLTFFKAKIKNLAIGSVQENINLGTFQNIKFLFPPIDEQKEISAALTYLDRKISNLRQQNETLEKIAQTLFKHWFVDFEFPNEDGKPYRSSGGEMVRSEHLGEIPAGWRVTPLDEVADFLNGLALQKYPANDNENSLPVIKIREMKAGITANTDRASLGVPSQYIIDNGDVLFSWSGSLEITVWCFGQGALNQHLFKVSSTKYPKWLYYFWTLEHLKHFRAIAKSKATTMGHIQRKHLSEALCCIPTKEQLNEIDVIMRPILDKTIQNSLQIQTLTKTRDRLLPKLMSGQLRIPQL
jgi:type I restriction enzyme S subunit